MPLPRLLQIFQIFPSPPSLGNLLQVRSCRCYFLIEISSAHAIAKRPTDYLSSRRVDPSETERKGEKDPRSSAVRSTRRDHPLGNATRVLNPPASRLFSSGPVRLSGEEAKKPGYLIICCPPCRCRSAGPAEKSMSTSLQSFANSHSPFSSRSQSKRMSQSQTPGLDTLAEGSQYALEQLQLARQAGATSHPPTDPDGKSPTDPELSRAPAEPFHNERNGPQMGRRSSSQQRDMLTEARSAIRKSSSATPVRRRISRACDQCNQLRTKCDGQHPCAHCLGKFPSNFTVHCAPLDFFRVWTRLRVCSRAQETRKGLQKGPCRRCSRGPAQRRWRPQQWHICPRKFT